MNRILPWNETDRAAPVLRVVHQLFGPYLAAAPTSAWRMKPSRFEARVMERLAALGVVAEGMVREVVLPVRVDHGLRRFMNGGIAGDIAGEGEGSESGISATSIPLSTTIAFQTSSTMELRLDFAWVHRSDPSALMVVEVDGSQHESSSHFFHGSNSAVRSRKRDDVKSSLIEQVTRDSRKIYFLRIPPSLEKPTRQNDGEIARLLFDWLRSSHTPPEIQLTPLLAPLPIPIPAPAAAATHHPRRAASLEVSQRSGGGYEEQERLRKLRTLYNRLCKEKAGADRAKVEKIKERQRASDTRKRPRDDTGFPYDLKWHRAAYRTMMGR